MAQAPRPCPRPSPPPHRPAPRQTFSRVDLSIKNPTLLFKTEPIIVMMATETTSYGTILALIHGQDNVPAQRAAGRWSRWTPLQLFRRNSLGRNSRAVRQSPAAAMLTNAFGTASQVAVPQAPSPFSPSGTQGHHEDDCCLENPCPICLVRYPSVAWAHESHCHTLRVPPLCPQHKLTHQPTHPPSPPSARSATLRRAGQ